MIDIHHKYLKKCYEQVYKFLGVSFEEVDKIEGWNNNYELAYDKQMELVNKVLESSGLPDWRKSSVITSYLLGCSPKFTNKYDI